MPPSNTNPLMLLVWIFAVFLGLPGLVLFVKVILFVGEASTNLKTVVKYVHDRRSIDAGMELTIAFMENDINALQDKTNLPRREWPDRRISGISDRRKRA